MTNSSKYKKGFTLVEVIIAMVLIIGTVAIFSTVAFSALKAGNSNKQTLQGSVLAQNYLEIIKSKKESGSIKNFGQLEDFIKGEGFVLNDGKYSKIEAREGIKYNIYIELFQREKDTVGELIEVVIEVKPQDANTVKVGTKIYLTGINE